MNITVVFNILLTFHPFEGMAIPMTKKFGRSLKPDKALQKMDKTVKTSNSLRFCAIRWMKEHQLPVSTETGSRWKELPEEEKDLWKAKAS